jgi:hypothetical protein
VRRAGPFAALVAVTALAAGGAGGAQGGSKITKLCVITATGAAGGNANGDIHTRRSTAGGTARTSGAKASLAIVCNFLSRGVEIRIPSHTIAMKTFVHGLPGKCTRADDTVSCRLDVAMQKTGLAYGGWKDTFAWAFTPSDSTSHDKVDGSCHVGLTVTLTDGRSIAYTKRTQTVCESALGDGLR